MHRDHVPTVPPSFHLLGSTTKTTNQGMVQFSDPDAHMPIPSDSMPQIHILTLQGHPEFTAEILKMIIGVRVQKGVLDKDTAEDGMEHVDDRNDGLDIARVIWKVLLQ